MGIMLPCMIDKIVPPLGFRSIQAARLMEWQGDSSHPEFVALIESIQVRIGISIVEEPAAPVVIQPPSPKTVIKNPSQKPPENYIETLPGGVKLEMVAIPGGEFMMGSNTFEDLQPIHKVTLKPFYMGKYQVTQKQWEAVMGNNPSSSKGDDLPVETVSWDDAKEFCKKLSEKTGREYRLPSESEWEYAARAGSKGEYCFGDDKSLLPEYAWFDANSGGQTHPVGQKKPNAWGLYDVHGNVWEWCEDLWHDNYKGAPDDGSAWVMDGNYRILRGGSWSGDHDVARAVFRDGIGPDGRGGYLGFRVVSSVRPSSKKT
ncbi:MAG: formylglycine-generating enzyme family protein [Acidobacteria bacterium]|nr:formylglycine-generating enzyme family protein [Acidobacteriota bacterium]